MLFLVLLLKPLEGGDGEQSRRHSFLSFCLCLARPCSSYTLIPPHMNTRAGSKKTERYYAERGDRMSGLLSGLKFVGKVSVG